MGSQCSSEQLFVGAETIQRRSIEVGDTAVERASEHGRRRFGCRRYAIGMAQIHAAETDCRDRVGSELSLQQLHGQTPTTSSLVADRVGMRPKRPALKSLMAVSISWREFMTNGP